MDIPNLITAAGVFAALLAALYARWSAISARASLEISRTALVATQRAFVFAPQLDALNIIDPETLTVQAIQVTPTWRNAGLTPARRLLASIEHKMITPNNPINITFDLPPPDTIRFDLAPQATFKGNMLTLTVPDLLNIMENKAKLLIWGHCEYDDVFENTPKHKTKYCFEVEVAIDPRAPINPNNLQTYFLRFKGTTNHNEAD